MRKLNEQEPVKDMIINNGHSVSKHSTTINQTALSANPLHPNETKRSRSSTLNTTNSMLHTPRCNKVMHNMNNMQANMNKMQARQSTDYGERECWPRPDF